MIKRAKHTRSSELKKAVIEYCRQMGQDKIWENKGRKEALERMERENKELLGEGENENHE